METEAKTNTGEIMASLAKLQKDMSFIKEHIEDITLTEDDLDSIEQARKDFNEGKTISHEQLKEELGL